MVFSLGACGKTKENGVVVTQQESSIHIESIDEEMISEESTTFNIDEEDDIELKDTIEIHPLFRRKMAVCILCL